MTVIVIGTLVLATWMLFPALRLQYREQRQKTALEAELASVQARNATILADINRLKTPEGVEQEARENLGLVKEGEQVYIVTEGEATRAPAPDVTEKTRSVQPTDTPLITKVLDLIFGVR